MRRTEPTLGKMDVPDHDRTRIPAPQVIVYGPSVWKIALGVALGMFLFALVSWLIALLIGATLLYSVGNALTREMQLPRPGKVAAPALPAYQMPPDTRRPLADNERCINGQRLRRIDSGWVQVGDDC